MWNLGQSQCTLPSFALVAPTIVEWTEADMDPADFQSKISYVAVGLAWINPRKVGFMKLTFFDKVIVAVTTWCQQKACITPAFTTHHSKPSIFILQAHFLINM